MLISIFVSSWEINVWNYGRCFHFSFSSGDNGLQSRFHVIVLYYNYPSHHNECHWMVIVRSSQPQNIVHCIKYSHKFKSHSGLWVLGSSNEPLAVLPPKWRHQGCRSLEWISKSDLSLDQSHEFLKVHPVRPLGHHIGNSLYIKSQVCAKRHSLSVKDCRLSSFSCVYFEYFNFC